MRRARTMYGSDARSAHTAARALRRGWAPRGGRETAARARLRTASRGAAAKGSRRPPARAPKAAQPRCDLGVRRSAPRCPRRCAKGARTGRPAPRAPTQRRDPPIATETRRHAPLRLRRCNDARNGRPAATGWPPRQARCVNAAGARTPTTGAAPSQAMGRARPRRAPPPPAAAARLTRRLICAPWCASGTIRTCARRT